MFLLQNFNSNIFFEKKSNNVAFKNWELIALLKVRYM